MHQDHHTTFMFLEGRGKATCSFTRPEGSQSFSATQLRCKTITRNHLRVGRLKAQEIGDSEEGGKGGFEAFDIYSRAISMILSLRLDVAIDIALFKIDSTPNPKQELLRANDSPQCFPAS